MFKRNLIDKLKCFSLIKKFEIDELIDIYEKSIDLLISDIIKSENLQYIDGILELRKSNRYINISIKLFFKDDNEKLIRKEVVDKISIYKIRDKKIEWNLIKYTIECPVL